LGLLEALFLLQYFITVFSYFVPAKTKTRSAWRTPKKAYKKNIKIFRRCILMVISVYGDFEDIFWQEGVGIKAYT
jgi:hypothetical protein